MLRYRERPVRGALAELVECVWAVWDPRVVPGRPAERIVPDGCPELIVHLGDPFARRTGGRWRRQPRVFVAGTLTQPWHLRPGPRVATVGMRFRPAALPVVLGLAPEADREMPLDRSAGRTLLARLQSERSVSGRLQAAEEWLAERLAAAPPAAPGARPAVARVLAARGRVGIAELARDLAWSRRRLERVFLRDLGIGPKVFARIVRLNAVLAALDGDDRRRAVDVALAAGYFDQAHLLRDFRALAGRSPSRPRSADGQLARHFTTEERLRVLLGE